jgi:hypothetical protein
MRRESFGVFGAAAVLRRQRAFRHPVFSERQPCGAGFLFMKSASMQWRRKPFARELVLHGDRPRNKPRPIWFALDFF